MAFAELTPINGGWTSWSSWSECSQQCHIYGQGSGYAIKSRHRTCSNPIPTFEGAACKGNSGEDAFCLNSCSCKCYNYSIYFNLSCFRCTTNQQYIFQTNKSLGHDFVMVFSFHNVFIQPRFFPRCKFYETL